MIPSFSQLKTKPVGYVLLFKYYHWSKLMNNHPCWGLYPKVLSQYYVEIPTGFQLSLPSSVKYCRVDLADLMVTLA